MEARLSRNLIVHGRRLLRRRGAVIALAVVAAGAAALLWSFLATPMYRATAVIQIERQNADVLTFQGLSRQDASWVSYANFYQTQYEILRSEAVARLAAERLQLVERPQYEKEAGRRGMLARILAVLPRTPASREVTPEEAATSFLLSRLTVSPVVNSELVQVEWVSESPELAAEAANAVVRAYIQYNLTSQGRTGEEAEKFLQDEVAELKKEVYDAERLLQDYAEHKNIVSADEESNITMRALEDLAERRTVAESVLAAREATLEAVNASPDEALVEVRSSPVVQRLQGDRAELAARLSELSRTFKDDWPEIRSLRSRLEQVESSLREEIGETARRVRLAAERDYVEARAEFEKLDGLLRSRETDAQALKRDAIEYNNLSSEVRKKRETLDALIARQNELSVSSSMTGLESASSNARIVSEARPPLAPYRPDHTVNLLLGLLVGLVSGVAAALLLEQVDNSVADPGEMESATGLPMLATIPPFEGHARGGRRRGRARTGAPDASPLVVHHNRKSPAAEAYRDLRTAILLSAAGNPPRTLLVTSSLPGEGKSSTSINLATVLAVSGRRVLVVDADLRRPSVHRAFGASNRRGLSTYLSGIEKSAVPLVVPTEIPGLDLLPSGPIPPNPSELLDSARFAELLAETGQGYEHVVIDSPPALAVADALAMAAQVDAIVLVARAESTPMPSLLHAVERFRLTGLRPVGIVLNDVVPDLESGGSGRYRYAYGSEHEGSEHETTEDDRSRRSESA